MIPMFYRYTIMKHEYKQRPKAIAFPQVIFNLAT